MLSAVFIAKDMFSLLSIGDLVAPQLEVFPLTLAFCNTQPLPLGGVREPQPSKSGPRMTRLSSNTY